MKILVISDSHGNAAVVKKIINSQPEASAVIFCGDGYMDFESSKLKFRGMDFYMVSGNGDFDTMLPLTKVIELGGKKIFAAHGHTYFVKADNKDIIFAAKQQGCQILVYGHTHIPKVDYEDGLYIINPGSCAGYKGSFAVIDIREGGILPTIISCAKI